MTTPHSTDALKQDDCRAEFESWALAEKVAYRDEQHGICFYDGSARAHQWIGWQAAWNRRPTPASDLCADLNAERINTTPASPDLDNEAAARLRKQAEEAKKVRGVVALSPEDAFALLDCLERAEAAHAALRKQMDEDWCPECHARESSAEAAAGAVPEGTPLLTGYAMRHRTGKDVGFSWDKDDATFGPMWERIPMIAAAPPAQGLPAAPDDPDDDPAFCAWIKDYRITDGQKWLAWGAWCAAKYSAPPAAAPSEPTLEGVNLDVIARSYGLYR